MVFTQTGEYIDKFLIIHLFNLVPGKEEIPSRKNTPALKKTHSIPVQHNKKVKPDVPGTYCNTYVFIIFAISKKYSLMNCID